MGGAKEIRSEAAPRVWLRSQEHGYDNRGGGSIARRAFQENDSQRVQRPNEQAQYVLQQ